MSECSMKPIQTYPFSEAFRKMEALPKKVELKGHQMLYSLQFLTTTQREGRQNSSQHNWEGKKDYRLKTQNSACDTRVPEQRIYKKANY